MWQKRTRAALAWLLAVALLAALLTSAMAEEAAAADDFSDIPIIDMEHHYYAQDFLDVAAERDEAPIYYPETHTYEYVKGVLMNLTPIEPKLLDLGDDRVAEMDRWGVTQAMLETSPGPEQILGEQGVELCRAQNDLIYEAMQKYPGRFLGSATLPVGDVDAACAELECCVKELGFVSWHTHSNYGDTYIDDEQYRPILKKAAELGVYVYLHPTMSNNPRINERGWQFSAAGFGFTEDTMSTLLAMITRGIFDEIPDLQVVTGHFGEALPFLMDRMDAHLNPDIDEDLVQQHPISWYFKHNIWVTTSGNMQASAFMLTKSVVGIDRILLGTDYPYESFDEELPFLNGLNLTREEREMLYYGNALRLMHISEEGTDGIVTPALIGKPTDYSDPANWAVLPEITQPVDTIYFYPTVQDATLSNFTPDIYSINSEVLRSEGARLYRQQGSAFEGVSNVFVPYYRGANISAVMAHRDNLETYQKYQQRTDVFAALDYYFENLNEGRPFILAGHSQGSMMVRIILDEYMRLHPELLDRMVAAYALGMSFTQAWLDEHPYVKFAEGADDTGVIVAWNTEGPGNKDADNMVVEEGAISINPINWKRDDTYAPAEDNLGSRTLNENGEYEIVPGINDAQLNLERGVVICTTSDRFVPLANLFGAESLHGVDFDLYYQNIHENAQTRIDAFFEKQNGDNEVDNAA